MILAAEAPLLTPLLVQMLVVGAALLLGLLFFGSGDVTRRQPLPDVEEDPDPVQVAYLRRQTSGLIELVMFDLVEEGLLEVVEVEEDEEFWAVQQVDGSEPPQPEDPWPGQQRLEDDEPEEVLEDEEPDEDGCEREGGGEEDGEDESTARPLVSPSQLVYHYFDTPKFPRQSLRPGGGLHSLLAYFTLPIQRQMVERHMMRSVASFQGCASGCLMAVGILALVAFVFGTFYYYVTLAFDGRPLPLVVLTVSMLVLRQLIRVTRFRLMKFFGFLRPRTSWGERYLEELESRFDSFLPAPGADGNGQQGAVRSLQFTSGEQRQALERLAVAVFGSWVLAGGPYEDVAFYLGTADPEESDDAP
ncbi:MAG: hypothetical protein QGH11_01345 [Pirellulaceae bacterium]|jgi:hypothetical protein|nr:hypothetical protein [Pirellulaceae bacterium]